MSDYIVLVPTLAVALFLWNGFLGMLQNAFDWSDETTERTGKVMAGIIIFPWIIYLFLTGQAYD